MNSLRNKGKLKNFFLIIIFCALIYLSLITFLNPQKEETQTPVSAFPVIEGDFKRASLDEVLFQFPLDHGPHEQYQTEWWYFTGNLQSASGNMYGYQLTFFRRGIVPPKDMIKRYTAWATNQIYLAHFSITEVDERKFHYWERVGRGAAGLAGAIGAPAFEVWLYDWHVEQRGKDQYHLVASQDEIRLDLILQDEKGPVLQGANGYSQKGPDEGNASIYYSLTRLASVGTLTIADQVLTVEGNSWMDHEYSTGALSGEQIGWDWFSLQLNDQREIMVYTIRRADGSIDPYSSGILVYSDGTTQRMGSQDFLITVGDFWQSGETGARYPASWVLEIPDENIRLSINPKVDNQELIVSFIYWEGAVTVSGQWDGDPVTGNGYVELTGYALSMRGQF